MMREAVSARSDGKCEACGAGDVRLEVHLITKGRSLPNGGMVASNAIALCVEGRDCKRVAARASEHDPEYGPSGLYYCIDSSLIKARSDACYISPRRSRVNPRNAARKTKRYDDHYGERAGWLRSLPCLIRGKAGHQCWGKIEAAHVVARGSGWKGPLLRKQVPACTGAHREMGERPGPGRYEGSERQAFEQKYDVDCMERAEWYAAEADRRGYDQDG